MNNRYLIFEEDEANQILSGIKEIKEMLKQKSQSYALLEQWLTNNEAKTVLKVSLRQMQKYRDSGVLKFSKVMAKIYYRAQDIQQFLLANYNSNNE